MAIFRPIEKAEFTRGGEGEKNQLGKRKFATAGEEGNEKCRRRK